MSRVLYHATRYGSSSYRNSKYNTEYVQSTMKSRYVEQRRRQQCQRWQDQRHAMARMGQNGTEEKANIYIQFFTRLRAFYFPFTPLIVSAFGAYDLVWFLLFAHRFPCLCVFLSHSLIHSLGMCVCVCCRRLVHNLYRVDVHNSACLLPGWITQRKSLRKCTNICISFVYSVCVYGRIKRKSSVWQ